MNDQDQSRLVANVKWFNDFFNGIRQLYEIVLETLSQDFFAENSTLTSGNFYFPSQKYAPTIPPYYVLMLGGEQVALQILTILDPELFGTPSLFAKAPSIVVVLHTQPSKYGYITDYALRLLGNRGIEVTRKAEGKFWGRINTKLPADFFAFQVSFDKFSADKNPNDAVREHIVDPINDYLRSFGPSEGRNYD